jgi:hypothetical protein
MAEEKEKKQDPYHIDLVPGVEQRREEWNLIFISDIRVGLDFSHTGMLEKVVMISGEEKQN